MKLKNVLTAGLFLLPYLAQAAGRNVAIDDSTGFNSAAVQAASGIQWNVARPSDVNIAADGSQLGAWAGSSFVLQGGRTVIGAGLRTAAAFEDGLMYFGGAEATPTLTPNYISLFGGANLVSGDPFNYRESVGVPYDGLLRGGYRLGEFSMANANRLLPIPFGGFDPNANDPNGYGALRRLTWFGLTDRVDDCSASQLDFANGNLAGTVCQNYESLPRYFGQIELRDFGAEEDGDFDLILRLGYGGLVYAPDGMQTSGYGNTLLYPASASGGGFNIGNQAYFFTAAEARSGEIYSEFHFRNGIACAVQFDGSCSGNFTVSDPDGGSVPAPSVALLMLLGGLSLKKRLNL